MVTEAERKKVDTNQKQLEGRERGSKRWTAAHARPQPTLALLAVGDWCGASVYLNPPGFHP